MCMCGPFLSSMSFFFFLVIFNSFSINSLKTKTQKITVSFSDENYGTCTLNDKDFPFIFFQGTCRGLR